MSIAHARPAYVAFAKDRFEVVTLAGDLDEQDLQAAQGAVPHPSEVGPKLIGTRVRPTEKNGRRCCSRALGVKTFTSFRSFYVPYEAVKEQVKQQAQPLDGPYKHHPEARQMVADAKLKMPEVAAALAAHPRQNILDGAAGRERRAAAGVSADRSVRLRRSDHFVIY